MELKLSEKPVKPVIIEGFPGFGLIGTIVTEFLIEHLKCKLIGKYWFEDLPASVAIHEEKLMHPIGIFYNKSNNIVIVHSIANTTGIEWKAADMIVDLTNFCKAEELISIEGVGSTAEVEESNIFYFSNKEDIKKKLEQISLKPLKEGIILGITSAIMLKSKVPTTCIFAETHSALPDSKAAAKIIQILDQYLGLKVDSKPLLEQAERFEKKLKNMIEQGKEATEAQEKKQLSYVG